MSDTTAPREWLDDVTIEVTEAEVMVDLDPAILLWQETFALAG